MRVYSGAAKNKYVLYRWSLIMWSVKNVANLVIREKWSVSFPGPVRNKIALVFAELLQWCQQTFTKFPHKIPDG